MAQVKPDVDTSGMEPAPGMQEVRCKLLGTPISHSLSPDIHRCFAQQHGISVDYEPAETRLDELRQCLWDLHQEGIQGVNLTVPLKERAIEYCRSISPRARACGAVNVLKAEPDGWHGDNTDGSGFWRDLTVRHDFRDRQASILVIGAGGAARGIVGQLLAESLDVVLAVRRLEQGVRLVGELGNHYPSSPAVYDLKALPQDQPFQLIINATSAGLMGQLPALESRLFASHPWVYDISYGSTARAFLSWAMRQGASRVTDGLGMLIEQAAEAFTLWTGRSCETDPVYDWFRSHYPV